MHARKLLDARGARFHTSDDADSIWQQLQMMALHSYRHPVLSQTWRHFSFVCCSPGYVRHISESNYFRAILKHLQYHTLSLKTLLAQAPSTKIAESRSNRRGKAFGGPWCTWMPCQQIRSIPGPQTLNPQSPKPSALPRHLGPRLSHPPKHHGFPLNWASSACRAGWVSTMVLRRSSREAPFEAVH